MSVIKPRRKESKARYVYTTYNMEDLMYDYAAQIDEKLYRVYVGKLTRLCSKLASCVVTVNRIKSTDTPMLKYKFAYANKAMSMVYDIGREMNLYYKHIKEVLPKMKDDKEKELTMAQTLKKTTSFLMSFMPLLEDEKVCLKGLIGKLKKNLEDAGIWESLDLVTTKEEALKNTLPNSKLGPVT